MVKLLESLFNAALNSDGLMVPMGRKLVLKRSVQLFNCPITFWDYNDVRRGSCIVSCSFSI